MEENWDTDVDSTQVVISSEEFSKIYSPPKNQNGDRGHYADNRPNRRGGRGDDGWGKSNDGNRGGGGGGGWGDDRQRGGGGGWGEDRQRGGQDRRDQRQGRSNDDDKDALHVEFDSGKVGMVIGRGGSKINEIQDKFGVNVKVCKFCNTYVCVQM